MFTGLVAHLGTVSAIERAAAGKSLVVDGAGWSHRAAVGESIAINGCCLTVVESRSGVLRFDVVPQTLAATTLGDLAPCVRVNLEHAVTPLTLLGGHLVQGHVDGVAVVSEVRTGEGAYVLSIDAPAPLARFIVEKGSVALDGVSLTVAALGCAGRFEVALVPKTLERTTLSLAKRGTRLNLETDYVVKALARLIEARSAD